MKSKSVFLPPCIYPQGNIDPSVVVDCDHDYLLLTFPEYEKLENELFNLIPREEIPLLIGVSGLYPRWVIKHLETRLKKGGNHAQLKTKQ